MGVFLVTVSFTDSIIDDTVARVSDLDESGRPVSGMVYVTVSAPVNDPGDGSPPAGLCEVMRKMKVSELRPITTPVKSHAAGS